MLKFNSNKTLGIILTILLLFVLYFYVGEGGRKERTLRKSLVSMDTTQVTEIFLYPKAQKGKEIKLFKNNNKWQILLSNGKSASVPNEKITALLTTLSKIKPNRLVARKKASWNEYQVGENATRVKVMNGSTETLNIIIGKFSFQQPRQMNSFVRLASDTDVYEVDGFLEMTFNKDENFFRNEIILKDNQKNWKSLEFNFSQKQFVLSNENGKWMIDGVNTDSAKTANYLNSLSHLTSLNFVDNFSGSNPNKTLIITKNDSTQLTIKEFVSDSSFVINSSVNSESYFNGNKDNLTNKIFVDKSSFFN